MSEVTGERLPNIHPGEVLREEYLEPLGITAYRLAKEIGVPLTRVTSILDGNRGITADTALRLGAFLRTSARFWLNLQARYEEREVLRSGLDVSFIKPWPRTDLDGHELPEAEPAAAA